MNNIARGDIAKYSQPAPDEVDDRMVTLEWNGDRDFGKHLNTSLTYPPVALLRREEIELVGRVDG